MNPSPGVRPPAWQPGHSPLSEKMIEIDPKQAGTSALYRLLIGAVVPRPIAWVSTKSTAGVTNLAPFSFFNGVSSNPPCLMISVARKPDGTLKDTWINIRDTKEFVVNLAGDWMVNPLHQTSAPYPFGVNEMSVVGLHPVSSIKVKPDRVDESAVQFECRLYKTIDIGEGGAGSATLIVGEILWAHVNESVWDNGKIKIEKLCPLSRLGGRFYGRTSDFFEMPVANP